MIELLKKRVKLIANYPSNKEKVGYIFTEALWQISWFEAMKQYPNLFREMKWYEDRTLDELMSVNYIRITIYTGYWRVGDVVNVTDYRIDTKNKKLDFYILDGTQQSLPERCEPATLEEYKADKAKRSGRKVEQ